MVLAEPKITAANHLPMINHYDAPNLLGSLLDLSVTGEEAYWDNIQTHVFRMYSAQSGRQVLDTQVEAPGMAVGISLSTLFLIAEALEIPPYKLLQFDD